MKKVIAVIFVLCLMFSLCSCSSANTKTEESISGEWIWREYPDNPMYMFLNFEDDSVRYGTNLFGQEMESATWDCTYSINDTELELTASDGTVFKFKIKKDGDKIRIFNDEGHEFINNN